jgi:cold shock CspA family protein
MQLKVTGTLKFFYASENYGFLVSEEDSEQRDVFFHYDDMQGAAFPMLTKDYLTHAAKDHTNFYRFRFNKLAYFGRYGLSMKAINIELVEIVSVPSAQEWLIQALTQDVGGAENGF